MKKRLFLPLLLLIPSLFSCSSLLNDEESQIVNTYKEDENPHDDLFKDAPIHFFKNEEVKRSSEDIIKPTIGVQYRLDGRGYYGTYREFLHVRYIGVVNSTHVKAEWVRAVAKEDGTVLKAKGIRESTVAYSQINGGSTYITPDSMNGKYFVVYTLYDIPLFDYNGDGQNVINHSWSVLAAGLKLTDLDDPNSSTMSKIVGVNLSNRRAFSFEESDLGESDYFIQGTINGESNQVVALDGDVSESSDHAKKSLDLKAKDNFGLFKWSDDDFRIYGSGHRMYSQFYAHNSEAITTDYTEVYKDGTYTLYLNGEDRFGLEADDVITDLYLDATEWNYSDARYALNAFGGTMGQKRFDFVPDTSAGNGHYKISDFNVGEYPQFNIVRMNGATTENNWDNKRDQTANISYKTDENNLNVLKNNFKVSFNNTESVYTRS